MILPGTPGAHNGIDPSDPYSSVLPRAPQPRVSKTFSLDQSQMRPPSGSPPQPQAQPQQQQQQPLQQPPSHGPVFESEVQQPGQPAILVGNPNEIAAQIKMRQQQQMAPQEHVQNVYNVVNVGASSNTSVFVPMLFSLCCTQQPGLESLPLVTITGNGGKLEMSLQGNGNTLDLPLLQSPWSYWKVFAVGSCAIVGQVRSSSTLSTVDQGSRVQLEPFDSARGGFYMIFPSNEIKDSNNFRLLCSSQGEDTTSHHSDYSNLGNTSILGQHQDYVRVEKREDATASFFRVSFKQSMSQLCYASSGYAVRLRGRTIPNSGVLAHVNRNDVLEFEQVVRSSWIGFGLISLL